MVCPRALLNKTQLKETSPDLFLWGPNPLRTPSCSHTEIEKNGSDVLALKIIWMVLCSSRDALGIMPYIALLMETGTGRALEKQ